MEKDHAVIALSEYNQLRDFKTEIEKGNSMKFYHGWNSSSSYTIVSKDDALKAAHEENEKLNKKNEDLKKRIQELEACKDLPKKSTDGRTVPVEEIINLSWWGFRTWKKSQK